MRRLGSTWGGGLVAALGVATAMACAQSPDESGYGLGGAPDAGNDGSVSLGDGAASTSSSGTSGKPSDGGGSSGTSGGGCTGKVVINEVLVGGASNADEEFIELFNPNACEVSLASWTLEYKAKSGNSGGQRVAFPSSAKIAAGGFLVAGTAQFGGQKQVTMMAGMASDGASVALLDGTKTIDAVGWGNATAGYTEGSTAPAPPAGDSIARKQDGVDTDDNKADFAVVPTPTPGKPN
jgi:hypothetical protein